MARILKRPYKAVLAASLLALSATGPAWPQDVDVSLKWRSETRTADQLAQAMERLYVVLYNTDSLPTRPWLDRRGVTVEQALRGNELFQGAFFPDGVDAVMCDLNPDVCARERVRVGEDALARVDAHVGGFRVSSGKWSNKAGDRLNLPALDFSAYTTLQQVEVAGVAELKRLLEDSAADCSQYGVSCDELVKRLNPQLEGVSSAGSAPIKVTVPVSGVETTLRFSADAAAEAATLSRVPDQLKSVKAPAPEPSDAVRQAPVYDTRWSEQLKARPPASSGIEALSPNIMSSGSVRLESSHEAGESDDAGDGETSVEAAYTRLLESIHYPFGDATAIPESFRVDVPVGVFDTFADTGHCDLGDNVEAVEVIGGGSARDPAEHCGELLPAPNVIDDHGTHVVGLLAATGSNGIGMWGLNPFARVLYVQVDKNQLRVPDYRGHLSNQMVQMYLGSRMKVANLSWRYTNSVGSIDTIADTIQALQQNFLVVVAAGNDNVDFSSGNCGELPACLTGYDNVITVVGLSRDGEGLWVSGEHGTNTSAEFHIAAIAEDVVSTVYGGYTGKMSGTSQAAPQVSAAASLIYAVHDSLYRAHESHLSPRRVKNRLMYTADLVTPLLDKVKSGRLNVERALDVGRTRIVLREDDGSEKLYAGNLVAFGNDPANELIICRTADFENLEIKRRDLRRMYYDGERDRYVVFRNRTSGSRDSPLERIVDCTLRTISHHGVIQTAEGPREFEFWQIRDYVSPMFE